MRKRVFWLSAMTMMVSVTAQAEMNVHYVATPEQSKWELKTNTPLECRLVHSIPHYGNAEFISRASKKINLDFELKMLRPMGATRNVSLIAMPPSWRPGENAKRIEQLQFFQQFDGYIGGQTAWDILSELEKGWYPTFSYHAWRSKDDLVEVGLSSVLFQDAYDKFSHCLSQLLPYSFEDISFTILHYQHDSVHVDKVSQQRLAQIAQYIKYNPDIDLVLVSTYTDGDGSKTDRQNLSERRAEVMQEYFKSLGLPEDRIRVEGYGKRRPIADDSSPIGQGKNRRVVISLGRTQV